MDAGAHMHGMASPPTNGTMGTGGSGGGRHMMMHMTFFWGKNTEILFSGWPGYNNIGMYILALFVVFFLAFGIEWISYSTAVRLHYSRGGRMLPTVLYGARVGIAYLVMLAVMSFNAGVFLVAILGHCAGFYLFGGINAADPGKESDVQPMNNGCV